MMRPNHALQRTRPSRPGCNPTPSWAGSLSLGRSAPRHFHMTHYIQIHSLHEPHLDLATLVGPDNLPFSTGLASFDTTRFSGVFFPFHGGTEDLQTSSSIVFSKGSTRHAIERIAPHRLGGETPHTPVRYEFQCSE